MIKRIICRLKWEYTQRIKNPGIVKKKVKIFCIGRNKTGTTSLKTAFEDLGFIVGNQRKAEKLLNEYIVANFKAIIKYCASAQVFQDFPFSYPETFKYLDEAFPGSKFILTIRDTPEQWYESVVKYHSKMFGKGKLPNAKDLMNARYVWKGWIWKCNRIMYKTPVTDPYNRKLVIQSYNDYNQSVMKYFEHRPADLIVINLSEKGSYLRLMKFLDIDSPFSDFPWENRTEKIAIK